MATTQEAIEGAICIDCAIPKGLQIPVLIWLYQQIAGVSTIQEMIDGAVCIDCTIPKGMQIPVLIGLVNAGGSGGGSGQVVALSGSNAPSSPPTDPTLAAVAYNGVPNLWVWDVATAAWFQII